MSTQLLEDILSLGETTVGCLLVPVTRLPQVIGLLGYYPEVEHGEGVAALCRLLPPPPSLP